MPHRSDAIESRLERLDAVLTELGVHTGMRAAIASLAEAAAVHADT